MNSYYVYLHKRNDDSSVFYIGKGHGDRAYTKSSRNKYWKNIVNSVGYTIELAYTDLLEDQALQLEIELIAKYKPSCNFTAGGEGVSGMKHSLESRQNMSKSHKDVKLSVEHSKNIAKSLTGKVRSTEHRKNYSKSKLGSLNPMSKKVIDMSTGATWDTAKEAAGAIGVNYGTLRSYLVGSRTNKTNLRYFHE
jgi:hypothetical protein